MAAMTLLCGSNGGFTARCLHWQLRSRGMQAVQSFTFARNPLPQVSSHTLAQAGPHEVEEPVPITAQCSIMHIFSPPVFVLITGCG